MKSTVWSNNLPIQSHVVKKNDYFNNNIIVYLHLSHFLQTKKKTVCSVNMPSRNRTRRTRGTQRIISAVQQNEQTKQNIHVDIEEKKKEIQKGTQVLCIYTLSLVWCVYETIEKVNTILNVVEEKMTVLNHSMKTLFEYIGHVQDERFTKYIDFSRKQHFATCFAKDMPISIGESKQLCLWNMYGPTCTTWSKTHP